jgi:hypothetical protein
VHPAVSTPNPVIIGPPPWNVVDPCDCLADSGPSIAEEDILLPRHARQRAGAGDEEC